MQILNIIFDPLEQFLVLPLHSTLCPGNFTNVSLTFIFIAGFLIFFYGHYSYMKWNRLHSIIHSIFNLTKSITEEYIAHHHQPFFPIVHFIFLLILSFNFTGLIPYSFTITSLLIVTLALSIMLQVGINMLGIYKHKLNFLNLFLPHGTPLLIAPFLIIIELISYFARILSLAIRLFVNMMAGHTLMKILIGFAWTMLSIGSIFYLYGLLPIMIVSAVICLELLISFLQAYVFTVLFAMYINDAINLH